LRNEVQRVRFPARGSFHADLKRRVEEYFEGSARSRHGGWAMAVKSVAIFAWLATSYALLMFTHVRPWQAALLSVSVALAMAGVGFSVMHDANHGSTSSNARVNAIMSFTLDLMGASSFLWRHKHNVLHHTYTNISTLDPDLEGGGPLLRLAPWQSRGVHHRFQHLYVWLLYGLFPLKWWFVDDVCELVRGPVRGKFPAARGRDLFVALTGKALFLSWAFVLPALLHPSWGLLAIWGLAIFTLGNLLAAVFQLAHCVDNADFLEGRGQVETDWAEHQVATTVDFAPANAVLGWYLGGLNFQVEHHLFPRVNHLHYPALARIVEETCRAHRLRYRCEPTLLSALAANLRWLRRMGSAAPA
jgi:linoleoyl-CoA desaturase